MTTPVLVTTMIGNEMGKEGKEALQTGRSVFGKCALVSFQVESLGTAIDGSTYLKGGFDYVKGRCAEHDSGCVVPRKGLGIEVSMGGR